MWEDRRDIVYSATIETLTYDNLNRLKTSKQGAIDYAANGNIDSKTEVSNQTVTINSYDAARPHAVSQYTFNGQPIAITYDGNGNLLTRSGGGSTWSMKWAGFDKPRWMAKTTGTSTVGSEFHYNAARSRVMQLEFDSMSGTAPNQTPLHYNRKRLYALGSTLELNYNNTVTTGSGQNWLLDTVRIYVPGPDGIIGAREFRPGVPAESQEKALVYHYDHLGSITAITTAFPKTTPGLATDATGKPGRFSEDAWGQRRNPFTWNGAPVTTGPNASDDGGADSLTPRGYTGHEMLDDLGLVHMNGRIYDPLLGRFLSADILVSNPGDLQSYNRYSYCGNNPLSTTDPSGFETDQETEERHRREEASANGTTCLYNGGGASTIKTPEAGTGKLDASTPASTPQAKAITAKVEKEVKDLGLKPGTKVKVEVKIDGKTVGYVYGTVMEAASVKVTAAVFSAAPNSLAGIRFTGPSSAPVDSTKPQDVLQVSNGTLTHDGGNGGSVFRTWTVDNPSQSGYIMQHVVRGSRLNYWEIWRVDVANGVVSYPNSRYDQVSFANTSTRFCQDKQSVVVDAVWLPGYQLNPNDNWQKSSNGFGSGDLLSVDSQPTGWPSSGPFIHNEGSSIMPMPAHNDWTLPRTATIQFDGQTIVAPVAPFR